MNTKNGYGLITIVLHWLMALLIVGLFTIGLYMEEMDYYDKWYNAAPWWHKGTGMLVLFLLLFRLSWTHFNTRPQPLASHHKWEVAAAKVTHIVFYFLIFLTCVSGYFIATAKGASVDVLGWFSVPAVGKLSINMTEFFEETHETAAYVMVILFGLHVAATIKHHFLDKDATLKRMLKPFS